MPSSIPPLCGHIGAELPFSSHTFVVAKSYGELMGACELATIDGDMLPMLFADGDVRTDSMSPLLL